ncbi:MAG: hypothetical protein IPK82_41415 [Polyangiaceae bacterium]|nr:hypothetical protein [Polyangiaceae bacterium]
MRRLPGNPNDLQLTPDKATRAQLNKKANVWRTEKGRTRFIMASVGR